MTNAESDILTTAAFLAAFSLNRQAVIPLAGMLITYLVKPYLFSHPIALLLSYSAIYATLSISYIRIKSEIRYAMIVHALLYWLLAVDYYLFEYATLYTQWFKPMVRLLDLYILYHLLMSGRLSYVANRLAHLAHSIRLALAANYFNVWLLRL